MFNVNIKFNCVLTSVKRKYVFKVNKEKIQQGIFSVTELEYRLKQIFCFCSIGTFFFLLNLHCSY